MAFHDVPFPAEIAVGMQGGPARTVDVVAARSGREVRNLAAALSRRRYTITVPPGLDHVRDALLHHWEGRRQGLHSFPLRDPADFRSSAPNVAPSATDQPIGTGDGATVEFQLRKSYEPGGPLPYLRDITKPAPASVKVAVGGVAQPTGWAVDRLTGVLTFTTPPAAGLAITAGFEFDVPVRYEDSQLVATILFRDDTGALPGVVEYAGIPLIEVIGE